MDLNIKKHIVIDFDAGTWPNGKVPKKITDLKKKSPRLTSVYAALLHTAFWTRPPSSYGFHLSDQWAWMRYGHAISASSDLRLRTEWDEIDPHQKTILSDVFGIGFTTELLMSELGFIIYADTISFLPLVASKFALAKVPKKKGPQKSPDYIVLDADGKFSVLECKGTQASRKNLDDALKKGINQKKGLKQLSGTRLRYSLVAGLFVPQFQSKENACIKIVDPVDTYLLDMLQNLRPIDIMVGVVQVALAKHFALMGLFSIANALASVRAVDGKSLEGVDKTELENLRTNDQAELVFRLELPHVVEILGKEKFGRANFKMQCDSGLYERLTESKNLRRDLLKIGRLTKDQKWSTEVKEHSAKLKSPLGFEADLSIEPMFLERGKDSLTNVTK